MICGVQFAVVVDGGASTYMPKWRERIEKAKQISPEIQ
jgi:hypothetical protein